MNRAFKKWFGKSQVVDDKGKPLVVFHGTPEPGFLIFDNKGAGKPGYFFSDSFAVAGSYAKERTFPVPVRFAPSEFKSLKDFVEFIKGLEEEEDSSFFYEVNRDLYEEEDDEMTYHRVDDAEGYEVISWETYKNDEDGDNEIIEEAALEEANNEIAGRVVGGNVYEVYLKMEDPLVIDADDANWDQIQIDADGEIYETNELGFLAQDLGHDGVIIKNVWDGGGGGGATFSTVFIVFSPSQIKAVANKGSWDVRDTVIVNPKKRKKRLKVKRKRTRR